MLEEAKRLVNEIISHGFKAYVVGGFVRDYILGIDSNDIDIATNATPKELKEIFADSCLPSEDYGSVTVIQKAIRFDITTFRKERGYIDNRRPTEVEYIDDIYDDLLRRDFTINTICMDVNGEIIDYLGGCKDIENRVIKTVGPAIERFSEDSLRILRAIRFAVTLDFELDSSVKEAISKTSYLLKNLSYNRKRQELDKIFTCPNVIKGIDLLCELKLDNVLELPRLRDVKATTSLMGIWSILDVIDKYPFSTNEKELIFSIQEVLNHNNLDPFILYKYGLYANSVAGEIKNLDLKDITRAYNELIIHSKADLDVSSDDIMKTLNKPGGRYLRTIFDDITKEVLYRRLNNNKNDIINYILNKY